jgi:hypothetical protein
MAWTVSEQRTVWNEADAVTNWTGSPALFTSEPTPKELSGCIGYTVSTTTVRAGYEDTTTPADLSSGVLLYVWAYGAGVMDTYANHGITLYVSDGTNEIGYDQAGSDVAVFRHNTGQISWQCLLIDTGNLPGTFVAYAGSEASLDWTNIEVIGVGFKTLSKAVGGLDNCFIDVIRYGNGGIVCYGGSSGTPETFSTLAAEDESNADGKAYGIIHELGTQLFGAQGPITLGDSAGTNSVYITDSAFTYVFEDRGLSTGKLGITVVSNGTGVTNINFQGGTLLAPAGVGAFWDSSDGDINQLVFNNMVVKGLTQGMTFASTGATVHVVSGCTFDGCSQVDPGATLFQDALITNSVTANGSMLLDSSGTSRMTNLEFVRGTGGHGIYITATGTHNFSNFTFSGFGADGTTTAAVYNDSGGAVTITVSNGGDTPTVRNGTGASTTVQNFKRIQIRAVDSETGNAIGNARVYLKAAAGGDLTEGTLITTGLTLGTGYYIDETFNYTNTQPVTGWVRRSTSGLGQLYREAKLGGQITADGYDVTALMVPDD